MRLKAMASELEGAPGVTLSLMHGDGPAPRVLQLVERGVDVGEVQVLAWGSFIYFKDPDGNAWAIQQLPPRAPAPA